MKAAALQNFRLRTLYYPAIFSYYFFLAQIKISLKLILKALGEYPGNMQRYLT